MTIPVPKYSIAISTYVYRYESYFKVLLSNLNRLRPDIEKVIFVNGQHKEPFDQEYRKRILSYAANFPNTYLIMSPFMRGGSFRSNTCINFTSEDYILILSDDILFDDGFFDYFESILKHNHSIGDESFIMNNHWGNFCAFRGDFIDPLRVGYFDERLIGLGEDDGDWMWRFENCFNRHIRNYHSSNLLKNSDEKCFPGKNTRKKGNSKYSAYNAEFFYGQKMEPDPTGTNFACGWWDKSYKTRPGMETPLMYPGEIWFREHQNEL